MHNVTLENVSSRNFTAVTIRRMYKLIDKGRRDKQLQDLAADLVRGCPWKDYQCFGNKLLQTVKKVVGYTPDPLEIERIHDPWITLQLRRADCDDLSILLAALGSGIGMDYRLVTIKASVDPQTGKPSDQWSHVYPILSPPGQGWYAADAVVKDSTFGWEAKGFEKKIWPKP